MAVYKRIGSKILPELFENSPNALGKRVKGKAEECVFLLQYLSIKVLTLIKTPKPGYCVQKTSQEATGDRRRLAERRR